MSRYAALQHTHTRSVDRPASWLFFFHSFFDCAAATMLPLLSFSFLFFASAPLQRCSHTLKPNMLALAGIAAQGRDEERLGLCLGLRVFTRSFIHSSHARPPYHTPSCSKLGALTSWARNEAELLLFYHKPSRWACNHVGGSAPSLPALPASVRNSVAKHGNHPQPTAEHRAMHIPQTGCAATRRRRRRRERGGWITTTTKMAARPHSCGHLLSPHRNS